MPLYEYLCHACGKRFEVLQKFADEPLLIHEGCGGKVDRLISTSALQFKGSGWYVNDYAKGAAGKAVDAKTEAKADGKTESKAETKTETATEAKAESKPAASESKPAAPSSPAASSE